MGGASPPPPWGPAAAAAGAAAEFIASHSLGEIRPSSERRARTSASRVAGRPEEETLPAAARRARERERARQMALTSLVSAGSTPGLDDMKASSFALRPASAAATAWAGSAGPSAGSWTDARTDAHCSWERRASSSTYLAPRESSSVWPALETEPGLLFILRARDRQVTVRIAISSSTSASEALGRPMMSPVSIWAWRAATASSGACCARRDVAMLNLDLPVRLSERP
mmetsp:Transcript_785/g.2105  ORF Transcript_785/g.2105 Transcript_785/m.2105 type:complete len:228 (-) Transcript_785:165-848(-)